VKRLLILGLAALGLMALLIVPIAAARPSTGPSTTHAVTVVVDFGNGRSVIRRVPFDGDTITGLAALQATGLDVTTGFGGAAVCRIETIGCPGDNCFCYPTTFWTYWIRTESGWSDPGVGAAQHRLRDGQTSGWHWGDYSSPPSLPDPQLAAYAALDWLRAQQQPDGGFSFYPDSGSTPSATLDAVLAGAAAHAHLSAWRSQTGKSPLDYLATQAASFSKISAASAGKLAAAVAAADANPHAFTGLDLIGQVQNYYDPATGQFGNNNWDQAWSELALLAAHRLVPAAALARLKETQHPDGSWGFAPTLDGDVDSTALMIQALIAAGEPITSTTLANAVAYLRTQRTADGGFRGFSGESSVSSAAFAMQGIIALGQNPLSTDWAIGGLTPVSAMLAFQSTAGGFKGFTGPNDLQATAQAIPALLGRSFPLPGRLVAAHAALDWMHTRQNADGGFPGFGSDSDIGATLDALFAIAAAGQRATDWRSGEGHTLLDFLSTEIATYTASSAARTGKTIVGVIAAGADPSSFGGVDLVERLDATHDANGQFGTTVTDQAWALLALAALRRSDPAAAAWLAEQQQANGGWEFAAGFGTDTNTTALALQALAVHPGSLNPTIVLSATSYLRGQQNPDGGFPFTKPSPFGINSDANSTASVVQALVAIGQEPTGLVWTTRLTGTTEISLTVQMPIDRLLAFQNPSGAFQYQAAFPDDNALATYQAVPALLDRPLPVKRIPLHIWLPIMIRN
jgi:prenyltransferase beta subunit